MKSSWSRRQVLKGAGIALSLPWLETFAPRTARAQTAAAKKRYISVYQPNGTAQYWMPTGQGSGTGWTLSPLLQPLQEQKTSLMVFANIANSAPFGGETYTNNKGLGSHGADSASTWTGTPPNGTGNANNGISVDQVIAQMNATGPNKTYLPGLQLGLSTHDSYGDGLPNQHSRSISWKSASEPLYKVINPQAVFDSLLAGRPMGGTNTTPTIDPVAERRRLLRKSSLDYIIESSTSLQARLGRSDQTRIDKFLSSVRTLEARVATQQSTMTGGSVMGCPAMPARAAAPVQVGTPPATYNRGEHADVMIELLTMAIQCDITRSVSFMLDDARSEFVYSFLNERIFTATGSSPNPNKAPVAEYHGLQHAGERNNNLNNGFATIGWWNSSKVSQIAAKLAAATEGTSNVLENTVITFASGMHGGDHLNNNLPVAILGSGGKVLKQDYFVPGAKELQLADVHYTILKQVFGYTGASFGVGKNIVSEILA
jgi:hypothetical protein